MPPTVRGRQAVNELHVFLRAMNEAQRRWTKRIASQEAKVRRLMIVEDNCKKKLRKSVLRTTNEQLKYLVSTDLLGSMDVKPPPRSAFQTFQFPLTQLSGFSIFVMARLYASPVHLSNVPQLTLVADLLSGWEVLPPSKKDQYEAYAENLKRGDDFKEGDIGMSAREELAPSPASGTSQLCTDDNKEEDMWERRAYCNFFSESRQQLETVVGAVHNSDWQQIAPKEWSRLTLRQKRRYLIE